MLLKCGVEENYWESLGLQGDPSSPSWRKLVLNIHGRTDVEAETPIFRPPDAKNWLIGKDPNARKDWRWKEQGTIEDELVGWHPWLDGHEFKQALGVGNDRETWHAAVPGITKSWTWLSDWTWPDSFVGLGKCLMSYIGIILSYIDVSSPYNVSCISPFICLCISP